MAIHRRQFVIGPEPHQARPDWLVRGLPSGWFLSHCPTLPLTETPHGLVLGRAVAMEEDAVPATWAGRWVLLTPSRLQQDTCSLLGCFYRDVGGRRWISSSPEVLRALDPELPLPQSRLQRDWRVMDWYPPPHSSITGVYRLLASQVMTLPDGAIEPVAMPAGQDGRDYEAILERSYSRLVTAMRNVAALAEEQGARVWIALTAGHDSRTLLATAVAAGIEAVAYTFVRPETKAWDVELPPRLAEAVGFEHVSIPLADPDPERIAEFEAHNGASYVGGAWIQHATRAWEVTEPGAVALEGGTFEVARCYYYPRLPRDMGATAEETTATILERFPSQRPDGVRAWVDWIRGEGRQESLDWRDRFFAEQRCGGWLSASNQGFDLSGRTMLYLANCHALLSDHMSIDEQTRYECVHQDELVRRMAPVLATYPYNPGGHPHHQIATRPEDTSRDGGVADRLRRLVRRPRP